MSIRITLRFKARGLVVDQSEAFLGIAHNRLARFPQRWALHQVRLQDGWPALVNNPAHAIVSMSAIHHLDAGEKRKCYRRAFQSLAPGGIFINGDEVRPGDDAAYLSQLRDWANQTDFVSPRRCGFQLPATNPGNRPVPVIRSEHGSRPPDPTC